MKTNHFLAAIAGVLLSGCDLWMDAMFAFMKDAGFL